MLRRADSGKDHMACVVLCGSALVYDRKALLHCLFTCGKCNRPLVNARVCYTFMLFVLYTDFDDDWQLIAVDRLANDNVE